MTTGTGGVTHESGAEMRPAARDLLSRLRQAVGGLACTAVLASTSPSLAGDWGGPHVRMVVTEAGARIEFDCAVGTISESLEPDGLGHFEAHGTYRPERGGPRQLGEPPPTSYPAVYRGWIDGENMRLSVIRLDTEEKVGSFQLGLGQPARLVKCL